MADPVPAPTVDLDAIRARAEAATPGPWTVETSGGVDVTGEGWSQVEVSFTGNWCGRAPGLMMGDHEEADADAEFVAHARTDVPALVAELSVLRAREASQAAALAQKDASLRVAEGALAQLVMDTPQQQALNDRLLAFVRRGLAASTVDDPAVLDGTTGSGKTG